MSNHGRLKESYREGEIMLRRRVEVPVGKPENSRGHPSTSVVIAPFSHLNKDSSHNILSYWSTSLIKF
jgi:hypothetical protein